MTMKQQDQRSTDAFPSTWSERPKAILNRRRQAEAVAQANAANSLERLEALSPEDARAMVHELRVHQIELEMQNEELRQAQVELDIVRGRYFDLYDLAPVGYCTLSAQGLLLEVNLTAATLLGLSRRALIRQPIARFIARADQDVYYLYRKRLLETGETLSCELRMVKHGGTEFWAHLVASDAQHSDGVAVRSIVLSDISDQKRLQATLQEKNAELQQARQIADKANAAKSEFLSNMSHELRSPLNAILGFAQLMEGGTPPPTPNQKGSIDQILRAGWYLLELINEILDLALIESGKLSLSLEPVSLPQILLDCQAMMEPQTEQKGVHLHFEPLGQACFVKADRTHLKQALLNLLSNAIKYNRVGGSIHVTCVPQTPGRLRLSVRDTGKGLSEEEVGQLFQPFNRLGQETGTEQGTGIGLVVTRRLVELMGGQIGVESTVGVGSVFWIDLKEASPPQFAPGTDETVVPPLAASSPEAGLRTLLYVEDNRANLQLVEQLVSRRPDMRLLSAADATNGIALARSHQPEVILMDINLPGISGLQALKILRDDPATRHIPVMALSANAMPTDIEKGLTAGFFRYLTKPIKIDEFMVALDLALEFAQTQSSAARLEKNK